MARKTKLTKNQKKIMSMYKGWKKKQTLTQKVNKILSKTAELKWFDHTQTPLDFWSGNAIVQVCTDVPLPAAGAQPTDFTRLGDSIKVTSIDIRGYVFYTPDPTDDDSCVIRLICFQYKPNNGLLAPSVARLLNNDDQGQPGPTSHQVIDYKNDYHILYDRTMVLVPTKAAASGGVSNQTKFFHINVPMKRATKKLEFDALTAAHNNAVYFVAFSNTLSTVGVKDPTIAYQTRMRFLDL